MNPTQKQMRAIARRPADYARFMLTGRPPRIVRPSSPLITLLNAIAPQDRIRIVGLTVGPNLGYSGSRQFHTAEQALRWIRPDAEMLASDHWPAESWRMKHFARNLHIEDLIAAAARCPEGLVQRYAALRAPRPPESQQRSRGETG